MKIILVIVLVALAAVGGWFLGKRDATGAAKTPETGGRKVLFYQSSMHPWIKSDKPGNCTICGMKLSPVFEGDTPKSVEENIIQLSTNSVNVLHVATATVVER